MVTFLQKDSYQIHIYRFDPTNGNRPYKKIGDEHIPTSVTLGEVIQGLSSGNELMDISERSRLDIRSLDAKYMLLDASGVIPLMAPPQKQSSKLYGTAIYLSLDNYVLQRKLTKRPLVLLFIDRTDLERDEPFPILSVSEKSRAVGKSTYQVLYTVKVDDFFD
jgi:hypothetical protein